MNFVAKLNPVVTHVLIICAISGAVFFTNLGTARLWDQDEPRNAGCAKEMLQRGDWIVPIFNHELRAQKPVLLYWLMMSAYSVFGVNEFSARFWSALLGIGTVLTTYFIGRRLFNPTVGLLASIVLASCTMFTVAARAATPDSLLIFCGSMALLIFVNGVFSRDSESLTETGFPNGYRSVFGIYFFLALGTLTKGPIGFLLPMAIIGMFMLLFRRNSSEPQGRSVGKNRFVSLLVGMGRLFHPLHFAKTVWAMRPLTAIGIVLAVAGPWYVIVGVQTEGDFLNLFFLKENFARATSAMESHSGGLWYYPVAIMFGFFPWSILTVPVLIGIVRSLRHRPDGVNDPRRSTDQQTYRLRAVQFLVCWVVVQVSLFSLASTKLPSYVTPCYPALAILTAFFLHSLATGREKVELLHRLAFGTFVFAGVGLVVAMVLVGSRYLDGDYRLAMLGAIPIVGGTLGLYFLVRSNQKRAVACLAAASIVLVIGIFGFGTVVVNQHRNENRILEKLKDCQQPVATFGAMESSWVFYTDRQIYELATAPAVNERRRQTLDRERHWQRTPWVSPEFFVAQNPGAMILTTDTQVENLLKRLPGYGIIESTDYFLKEDQLALIGPKSQSL